jgi:hypothetical protein
MLEGRVSKWSNMLEGRVSRWSDMLEGRVSRWSDMLEGRVSKWSNMLEGRVSRSRTPDGGTTHVQKAVKGIYMGYMGYCVQGVFVMIPESCVCYNICKLCSQSMHGLQFSRAMNMMVFMPLPQWLAVHTYFQACLVLASMWCSDATMGMFNKLCCGFKANFSHPHLQACRTLLIT